MARVAVLAGDGIGREVTAAAQRVLAEAVPSLAFEEALVGASAIAACGTALPGETLAACERADAILFGAVGGAFNDIAPADRPEAAILRLRKHFDLFANVRPARVFPGLEDRSPLRERYARGVDMVIVRELTAGLYFGDKTLASENGVTTARESLVYTQDEIERVVRFGFELARLRRGKLTSIDKANVMISSQLWRRVADQTASDFTDVRLEHMLADNAAMQLMREPAQFDVIVTDNTFGDILSDEAAMIGGSIGLAPSASLASMPAERGFGLYEPIAGTAPDIAGRDVANPVAAILSAALLCRFSLGDEPAARAIENAVEATLARGPHTADIASPPSSAVGTRAFTDAVVGTLRKTFASQNGTKTAV
ncbi:MAG: 3-isopropylmalate dehydrogenase [Candidatus Velthaea sp.]